VTFADRTDAGRRLGAAVVARVTPTAVTLAIPRGGVIVGAEVARALGGPLEVVVPRKLGAPGNPELGIGAVASGVRVLDARAIAQLGIPTGHLEREIVAQEAEVERREREYRRGRPAIDLEGATAVVVDDGIATGVTAIAALRWARNAAASRVVLAVPVAPPATLRRLAEEADDVIALETPPRFLAVGEWYEDFAQTTDAEVLAALERGAGHAA
jgi:predicted phosphoribosyltransferase